MDAEEQTEERRVLDGVEQTGDQLAPGEPDILPS